MGMETNPMTLVKRTEMEPSDYETAVRLLYDLAAKVDAPPRRGGTFALMAACLAHTDCKLLEEILAEMGAAAVLQATRDQRGMRTPHEL